MPITVVIDERLVAKTEENTELLQLWYASHDNVPIEVHNPLDPSLIDDVETKAAVVKRFLKTWNTHIGDSGQNVKLEKVEADLDSYAYEFYKEFNTFLNTVAMQMGLTSDIDRQTQPGRDAPSEWYGLLKTILLKMMLKILSNKGDQDHSSQNYQKILDNFIRKLSTSTVALKKNFINGESPTKFTDCFLKDMVLWKEKINWMVVEIAKINITKNTVEKNLKYLEDLQRHVLRYLYIRLRFLESGEQVLHTDFANDWIINYVNFAEEQILGTDKTYKPLPSSELSTGSHAVVTVERGNAVCAILERKNSANRDNLDIIKHLYSALYDITFIKNSVKTIDTLVTMSGCLPFLVKYINATALGHYINIYSKACFDACVDNDLNGTIITTVIACYGRPSDTIDLLPFSQLGDSKILKSMSSTISAVLSELTRACATHGCHNIINESYKFIFVSNEKRDQELLMLSNETPRDSLLSCLGLPRAALVDLWNHLQLENDSWKSVALEAYEMLKDEAIPPQLQVFFKDKKYFDIDVYQAPFLMSYNLAEKIRNTLKENDSLLEIQAQSNLDLIKYVEKQNNPCLNQYIKSVQDYKKAMELNHSLLLNVSESQKEFALAWFKYWYLDNHGDLIFLSNNRRTTLNILTECHGLSVKISKLNPETNEMEDDESNVRKNYERAIHIKYSNYITKAVLPYVISSSTSPSPIPASSLDILSDDFPCVAQNKAGLTDFLFEVLHKSLEPDDAKSIFDYFLTSNKMLSERGVSGTSNVQEQAKNIIDTCVRAGQTLDGYFYTEAKKHIFSGIKDCLESSSKLKPKQLSSKIERTLIALTKSYFEEKIFTDYRGKASSMRSQVMVDNKPVTLLLSDTLERDGFLGFKDDPLTHYVKIDGDEYAGFQEVTAIGDGNCALYAMDIDTRISLISTVRNSVKNEDNRAKLAIEICQVLMLHSSNYKDTDPARKKWGEIALDDWNRLYAIYNTVIEAIECKRELISGYGICTNLAPNELIKSANSPELNLTKQQKVKVQEFSASVVLLEESRVKMIEYCSGLDLCNKYIDVCAADNVWIGKYMLHLYAKEKDYSLYIYDQQRTNGLHFQEMVLDGEASFNCKTPQKHVHIIYKNGSHFDKLLPCFNSKKIASSYLENLEKRIKELTQVCYLKEGQPLKDFNDALNKADLASCTGMALTFKEQHRLARSYDIVNEAKDGLIFIEERKRQFLSFEKKAVILPFIQQIKALEEQMILVDEIRDKKNRTLLYNTVENGNVKLMDYLLVKQASVISRNEGNFLISSELPEGKDCVYVLKRDDTNEWGLTYYENSNTTPLVVDIKDILGLELFLKNQDTKESSMICQDVDALIRPYHEKTHLKTPLMLASKKIGFSKENPLYFTLLTHAQKEMAMVPSVDSEKYPALQYCVNNIILPLREHLGSYVLLQKTRWDSPFYVWWSSWMPRENFARARELATLFEMVINTAHKHNYTEFLDILSELVEAAKLKRSSVLHQGLIPILDEAVIWRKKNTVQLNRESNTFQIARRTEEFINSELAEKDKEVKAVTDKVALEKQKTAAALKAKEDTERGLKEEQQKTNELKQQLEGHQQKDEATAALIKKMRERIEMMEKERHSNPNPNPNPEPNPEPNLEPNLEPNPGVKLAPKSEIKQESAMEKCVVVTPSSIIRPIPDLTSKSTLFDMVSAGYDAFIEKIKPESEPKLKLNVESIPEPKVESIPEPKEESDSDKWMEIDLNPIVEPTPEPTSESAVGSKVAAVIGFFRSAGSAEKPAGDSPKNTVRNTL